MWCQIQEAAHICLNERHNDCRAGHALQKHSLPLPGSCKPPDDARSCVCCMESPAALCQICSLMGGGGHTSPGYKAANPIFVTQEALQRCDDAAAAWEEAGERAVKQLQTAVALDARAEWNHALAHALLFGAWAAAQGLAPPGDELAADPAWRLPTGA